MKTPNMIRRVLKKVKKRFLRVKKEKHTKIKNLIPARNWLDYHGSNNHKSKTFKQNKRLGY